MHIQTSAAACLASASTGASANIVAPSTVHISEGSFAVVSILVITRFEPETRTHVYGGEPDCASVKGLQFAQAHQSAIIAEELHFGCHLSRGAGHQSGSLITSVSSLGGMKELLPRSQGTEDGGRKQNLLLRYVAGICVLTALVLVSSSAMGQVILELQLLIVVVSARMRRKRHCMSCCLSPHH